MAVTKVGAIYATQSKLLQRVYVPHADDGEINQQHVGAGETRTTAPLATYQTGGPSAVQALIGTPTFSGRCVVIDGTNTVIDVVIADPTLYTDSRGTVVPNDLAIPGDLWTGSVFTRRYVEVNPLAATALTAIVAVSVQNIATAAPATAGDILIASTTLNVGSAISPTLLARLKALAGG